MNTESAKGIRRFDLNDLLDNGAKGDFFIGENKQTIWIHIPGSGLICLPIKVGEKVTEHWQWDGNEDAPTIMPSIHVLEHWHGWMKNGELVSC